MRWCAVCATPFSPSHTREVCCSETLQESPPDGFPLPDDVHDAIRVGD